MSLARREVIKQRPHEIASPPFCGVGSGRTCNHTRDTHCDTEHRTTALSARPFQTVIFRGTVSFGATYSVMRSHLNDAQLRPR